MRIGFWASRKRKDGHTRVYPAFFTLPTPTGIFPLNGTEILPNQTVGGRGRPQKKTTKPCASTRASFLPGVVSGDTIHHPFLYLCHLQMEKKKQLN